MRGKRAKHIRRVVIKTMQDLDITDKTFIKQIYRNVKKEYTYGYTPNIKG